ncbi:Methionine--tRNA ligase, cytoplasmic [Aphelenchoides besseyi]|nr:Methionine--tRNA ligase, cytoplasmic [Aphelenchoides besseyi]
MSVESSWRTKPLTMKENVKEKLPIEGKRNVLITAALPYVNNVPHLGNIIGCVLSSDVFARFCRIRGYQSLHICGTDEYGTATEMKALKEGMTPEEICSKFYELHKGIYEWFGIDFDYFGRTSTENQTEICQDIFNKLYQNGFTSKSSTPQLHCSKCEKFLADRFVFGTCPHCGFEDARGDQCDKCAKLLDGVDLINPKCHICGTTPGPKVEEYLNTVMEVPSSHWSSNAISIARGWLKIGLEPRCITRDLKWGTKVPLPGFENKVFYVWFDAPIGYLSMTKTLLGDNWTKWWKNPEQVELFQFLGKDNVAFHSIVFPATQMGANDNFTMIRHLCATEYLNYEDQKFSKSRGTGVFGDSVAETGIPADVWRFYLIYMRPESQDTKFSWDDFLNKVNSELLANLGNFVLRAIKFIKSTFNGIVPKVVFNDEDLELVKSINELIKEYTNNMEQVNMREALQNVLSISRLGNKYMQDNKPWELAKNEETEERGGSVVALSANISILLATLLYPFMPTVSKTIRSQCKLESPFLLPEHFVQFLPDGWEIGEPKPLFEKLDPKKIEEFKKRFGAQEAQPPQISKRAAKKAAKAAKASKMKSEKGSKSSNREKSKGRREERLEMVQSDPIFHEMPKHEKKIKVDARFKAMFEDEEFSSTRAKIDKRGRPVERKAYEKLDNVYELDSDDGGSTDEESSKICVEKPLAKSLDLARGEGNLSSSSEDSSADESEEGENEDDEFGIHDRWGAMDHDVKRVDWISPRLAVCNLDWERMTAEDIFMALQSFKPKTGSMLSVDVYLSDFGREQLDYEQKNGPKLPSKPKKTEDSDEDNEELPTESIRAYQMDRCRMYYAVVTCDSDKTANAIYEACDGFEYMNSGIALDLRFIPDDMEFDKDRLRDSCAPNTVNSKHYTPKHFRSAIVKTAAKLEWDDGDFHRQRKIQKAFDEDADLDEFSNLIGSGSEGEEDESNTNAAQELFSAAGIMPIVDEYKSQSKSTTKTKKPKAKTSQLAKAKQQKRKKLSEATAKLTADMDDKRFSALYTNSAFAIDKTNPHYKNTVLADQQVAEKRRRKAQD